MTDLPYPPPYQGVATLAEHLDVSESTIDNWVKLGQFPKPKKIGGKRLWSWREVRRYIEAPDLEERVTHNEEYEAGILNFRYPLPRASRVYFVQLNNMIKIGFTDDLRQRMIQLMNDSPYQIKLLHSALGDRNLERSYHLQFAKLCVRGEWFHADQELIDFIQMLEGEQ
jgi:predicted DNA-binding transcriptional regulator AlpA